MGHNPKKKTELFTSICAAALLGFAVLVTQTDVISAQSSNFQGGQPEISQTPDTVSYTHLTLPTILLV